MALLVVSLVLAALCFSLYLPSLNAQFVYDSRAQILIDDYIHDFGNIWEILTLKVLTLDVMDFNRPVMLLSLMADSLIWDKNPAGYHLTSLLIHALNTALLLLLIAHILKKSLCEPQPRDFLFAAFGGAFFFAVHPVNSETVCSVAFREDLLVTLFFLLAMHSAVCFSSRSKGGKILFGGICVFCLFLAAAAKESGAAGPVILLLYFVLFDRDDSLQPKILLVLASLAAVLAFLAARFLLAPETSVIFFADPAYPGGSLANALKIQPKIFFLYVKNIVWPDTLSADYGPLFIKETGMVTSLSALFLIPLLSFLLLRPLKTALFSLGVIGFATLPVSNLVPMYRHMADRFLYFPMIGVSLLAALLLMNILTRGKKAVKVAVFCFLAVVVILFSGVTLERQKVWQNRVSLWEDTLQKNPASSTAANNLGFALFDRGVYEKAVNVWKKAVIMTKGKRADPWAGLAIGLDAAGRKWLAEKAFKEAVRIDPFYRNPMQLVKRLTWDERQAEHLRRIAERCLD